MAAPRILTDPMTQGCWKKGEDRWHTWRHLEVAAWYTPVWFYCTTCLSMICTDFPVKPVPERTDD